MIKAGLLRYLMVVRQTRPQSVFGLDRERELGEGRRQLAPRVDIHTELVVASVEVLHEGVSCADYSR
jgi:hypothetical protein